MTCEETGEGLQGTAGQIDTGRADKHAKAPGGLVVLVVIPSTRSSAALVDRQDKRERGQAVLAEAAGVTAVGPDEFQPVVSAGHLASSSFAAERSTMSALVTMTPSSRPRGSCQRCARSASASSFQHFHLTAGVRAIDNVAEGLLYAGIPIAERRRAAHTAQERVSLSHRVYHRSIVSSLDLHTAKIEGICNSTVRS
ncbi:MAG TPA: hypothetical protein VIS09_05540 [Streptomyces sp.]